MHVPRLADRSAPDLGFRVFCHPQWGLHVGREGSRIDPWSGNIVLTVRRISFHMTLRESSASTCRALAYTLISASYARYMKSGESLLRPPLSRDG